MTSERFYEEAGDDRRRHAPAAERNGEVIAGVLDDWLPPAGTVLEVASGTGQHVAAFARRFASLHWQPSDPNDAALASIAAWRGADAPDNLAAPIGIDVADDHWPIAHADAVVAINLVHISPWAASLGLLAGAGRLLPAGGPLILYGPWFERGVATAPSNLAFDADLRHRNSDWGLREVEQFAQVAETHGLDLVERRCVPANNLMLLFRRR